MKIANPYIRPGLPSHVLEEEIFKRVCKHFREDPEIVRKLDKTRKRKYVMIRQISMTLIKWRTGVSWAKTASYFNFDHSNAIHAVKTILDLWDTDKRFREKVSCLFEGERPVIKFREYSNN